MTVTRSSSAVWEGDLKSGKGKMIVGRNIFEGVYSAASRFERGQGTNPEELIGAAHAGCFSMALAAGIARRGYAPRKISTTAVVSLDQTDKGPTITSIALSTEAAVPAMGEEEFKSEAEAAKAGCPVSRALSGVDIRLEARLLKD